MGMRFEAVSHVGWKRKHNEDRCLGLRQNDGSLLLVVADGMGGMPGGEEAASLAVDAYRKSAGGRTITESLLKRPALDAQRDILRLGRSSGMEGMGTTLTAALVRNDGLCWVHIGDSRLYRFSAGRLEQLTQDHRFLSSMIRDGDISLEEARRHPLRNLLDQCLGCPEPEFENGRSELLAGDSVLLCTDGLCDELDAEAMEMLLAKNGSAAGKASALLEAALAAGGRDNITIILAEGESPATRGEEGALLRKRGRFA